VTSTGNVDGYHDGDTQIHPLGFLFLLYFFFNICCGLFNSTEGILAAYSCSIQHQGKIPDKKLDCKCQSLYIHFLLPFLSLKQALSEWPFVAVFLSSLASVKMSMFESELF